MKKSLLLSLLLMAGYASAVEYPQELLMKWKNPEARAIVVKAFKEEKMNNEQFLNLVNTEIGREFNKLSDNDKIVFERIEGVELTKEESDHLDDLILDFMREELKYKNKFKFDIEPNLLGY